jgi:WD40 repeat protein
MSLPPAKSELSSGERDDGASFAAPSSEPVASDATRTASSGSSPAPDARPPAAPRLAALDDRCDPARYHVLGEHGRGGLGKVLRAHDLRLGRDVAIKELISRGPVAEARFAREAAITARLEHPGIVPVHEAGRWLDGTPFYAMKLVAGRPLRDLIAACRTIAERIGLLHHVIAVADAIAYAHGRGIIHRDLKPSNIIVGDYGETVVIDWGLAKDLVAVEEASADAGPTSSASDESLTSAGAVLGTPAYMAPEQARGEAVDQRADVFAIGAMLWELCSLERLPAAHTGQRHRMMRRARIDPDLAAIIEKAVDPDPVLRYQDAGALAADLKAFKSGARIAARSYSPFHVLAHWTRRHRALAVSVTAALALAIVGVVLYVRNIAIERDRADAALRRAESATRAALEANTATEAALADQTLKRAELLLSSDPSAAQDVLATYRGQDRFSRDLLRTQAEGRGVARLRATPHASAAIWIRGLPDRSVATLGVDGTITVVSPAGDIKVIARDASKTTTFAYAEKRRVLAYICRGDHICLVDFSRAVPTISPPFGGASVGLGFSPAEDRLGASGHNGGVVVWDVSDVQQPVVRSRGPGVGWNLTFLDEDTMVVNTADQLTISTPRGTTRFALPNATTLDASQARHMLAFGMADGTAAVVRPTASELGPRVKLCAGVVRTLQLVPQADQAVFGCKDGSVGLWDLAASAVTPLANLVGAMECTAASADGRQVAIGGSSGIVSIIDLQTRIVTSYLGHRVRLGTLAGPTADYPFFVSADVNGHLRGWSPPLALAHVALTAPLALFDLQLLPDSATAIATTTGAPILVVSPRGLREAAPHDINAPFIALSPDGTQFAAYGFGPKFELWSSSEFRRLQLIETQQPATAQLRFLAADDLVWGGSEGRLLRWSRAGGSATLATFPQPIITFAVSPRDHALAVALADGALWTVALDGKAAHLATQTEKASTLQSSSDGHWLAAGSPAGVVVVYDTARWQPRAVLRSSGQIRNLAFSPRGDVLAVATTSGLVHLGRAASGPSGVDWEPSRITWTSFTAYPRDLAFSPDGELAMISCAGGVVWFYSISKDRWLYYPTGTASSITAIRAGVDGRSAATADSDGRVLMFDPKAVRDALGGPPVP